jgi:hypothetical protein
MDLARIVSELKKERDRIHRAIAALDGESSQKQNTRVSKILETTVPKTRHRMSAAGRRRISEAMKKRWAARKKTTGKQAAKAA